MQSFCRGLKGDASQWIEMLCLFDALRELFTRFSSIVFRFWCPSYLAWSLKFLQLEWNVWKYLFHIHYNIYCNFIFNSTNSLGCLYDLKIQFKVVKLLTWLLVHLWDFQITHGGKQTEHVNLLTPTILPSTSGTYHGLTWSCHVTCSSRSSRGRPEDSLSDCYYTKV